MTSPLVRTHDGRAMTLPASWPIVHITGTYVGLDGTPCKGQVIFSAPCEVAVDGVVVVPRRLMFNLDAAGTVAGDVPASDYPDADAPFAYVVSEQLQGQASSSYALIVPAGAALDLSSAVPAVTDPAAPAYRLEIGDVTDGDTAAASLAPVSRHVQKLNLTLPKGAIGGLPTGGSNGEVLTRAGASAQWAPATINWQSTNW